MRQLTAYMRPAKPNPGIAHAESAESDSMYHGTASVPGAPHSSISESSELREPEPRESEHSTAATTSPSTSGRVNAEVTLSRAG